MYQKTLRRNSLNAAVGVAVILSLVATSYDGSAKPSDVRLAHSPLLPPEPDWIDLGTEGSKLYLAADFVPGTSLGAAELVLTTHDGAQRFRLDFAPRGNVHLWLYPKSVSGPAVDPTKKHKLLLRIISHKEKPDEVYLKISPTDTLPAEPAADAEWTLISRVGFSNADLARCTIRGGDGANLRDVRVAGSYAELKSASPLDSSVRHN